eukprot:TRINITY_DN13833_c0_g2_i1.p1 TRINITY_DN13833_c0_g2~~TRINITY_DN13833_c0_g2_i1.p1  ORF type:complete len:156 (-),score=36.34 TRINITY_DN13833_c0_g2_i1:69-536(-)
MVFIGILQIAFSAMAIASLSSSNYNSSYYRAFYTQSLIIGILTTVVSILQLFICKIFSDALAILEIEQPPVVAVAMGAGIVMTPYGQQPGAYPPAGYPVQAYPSQHQQGYPQQAYPQQAYPQQAYPQQAYPGQPVYLGQPGIPQQQQYPPTYTQA